MDDGLLFVKPAKQQEIDFYTQTQASCGDGDPGSELVDWIPVFMGTLTKGDTTIQRKNESNEDESNGKNEDLIVLQNLYYGFDSPSILDIKLGAQLTDDTVTAEKAARLAQVSATTTSGSLGFRICGMKVYNGSSEALPVEAYPGANDTAVLEKNGSGVYVVYDKRLGRTVDKSNVGTALHQYFASHFERILPPDQAARLVGRLLEVFLKRLRLLHACLAKSDVRIFSGSLLFVYEGSLERWDRNGRLKSLLEDDEAYEEVDPVVRREEGDEEEEEDEEEREEEEEIEKEAPLSSLHLIDFAHAKWVKGEGGDRNVMGGVENLIKQLSEAKSFKKSTVDNS